MIRKAVLSDAPRIAALALRLWPDNVPGELEAEFQDFIAGESSAVFVLENEGKALAFAQCALRHDYVEGTESSPVGYLEGIFVDESIRRQGAAKALLQACESWAREKGCTEFASDCELSNADSLRFHLGCGFEEANRIICFTKRL